MLLWYEESFIVSISHSFRKHLLLYRCRSVSLQYIIEDNGDVDTSLGPAFEFPYV